MIVLGADVGGTKTRLGLFRARGDALEPVRAVTVPSDADRSFEDVLAGFLGDSDPPSAACVAVAGPVIDQRAAMTNHPWVIDAAVLSGVLSGVPTRVVNDLEAGVVALPHLPLSRTFDLAPDVRAGRPGNVALVSPGTGLGCASLCWDGARHHPVASEGGHGDFAPRDDREIELLRYLRARHEHVSWERILSGAGLVALYAFARDTGLAEESPRVRERLAASDPAAVVSDAACHEGDPLSSAAVELFVRILGAKAGNLALEVYALGGVFIGGGIAPKILPKLAEGPLLHAFRSKGRQRPLLERIPLRVSLEPDLPLLGAARLARDDGLAGRPAAGRT